MRTCSLTLKGPGLSENSQRFPLKKTRSVILEAINRPSGTTAIWAEMAVMERGSLRYQKNWLRKERRTQERVPRNHIRKVRTGREGSSVVGTVRATWGIGEFSSDSEISGTGGGEIDEEDEACCCCWCCSCLGTELKRKKKKGWMNNNDFDHIEMREDEELTKVFKLNSY